MDTKIQLNIEKKETKKQLEEVFCLEALFYSKVDEREDALKAFNSTSKAFKIFFDREVQKEWLTLLTALEVDKKALSTLTAESNILLKQLEDIEEALESIYHSELFNVIEDALEEDALNYDLDLYKAHIEDIDDIEDELPKDTIYYGKMFINSNLEKIAEYNNDIAISNVLIKDTFEDLREYQKQLETALDCGEYENSLEIESDIKNCYDYISEWQKDIFNSKDKINQIIEWITT